MKCNIEWLSAYLDGALAEEKRALLEEHLKTCEACTVKLEEFARVEQGAKKIPAPQLSEAYWENFAGRVQNKLTIREKQRTSPGWLEALKGLFQPTTGKLAIAGSVAVIILLTFISLDQWKKQTFRPPVFEDEKPVVEGKIDSAQTSGKDESEFRTAEKDNKVGLVEDKRLDQPARERGTATLSQKPAENRPAASAPLGKALAAPEGQESKEEPSLAAFGERDEAPKEDTVFATAEKKAKEMEKALLQNRGGLQKRSLVASPTKGRIQSSEANDTISSSVGIEANNATDSNKVVAKSVALKESVQESALIKGGFDTQYGGKTTMSAIDTATRDSNKVPYTINGGPVRNILNSNAPMDYARQKIKEAEKELGERIPLSQAESIYVALGNRYLQLYRATSLEKDWKTANRRVIDFLKKELSDSTRQRLVQIQAELKKLKK